MSGLRKLFNIVQNLDPLILQGILADQPYLMRLCELELGPEDSEDETIEFTGSVELTSSHHPGKLGGGFLKRLRSHQDGS